MKGGQRPRLLGGCRQSSDGFTIIETLIVLAISGAILIMAMAAMSGKTAQNEFTQSVRSVQSQISSDIGSIRSGYYPSVDNLKCTATITGPTVTSVAAGSVPAGTNQGCVFLGKVLRFGSGNTTSNGTEQYHAYTVAALALSTTGTDCAALVGNTADLTCLQQTKPTIVAAGQNGFSEYTTNNLQYGLTVGKVYYGGVPANSNIASIAFLASQGTGAAISGDGSQHVNLVLLRNTNLTDNQGLGVANANSALKNLTAADINPTGGVQICLVSGTTQQTAILSIGDNTSDLSVDLNIKGVHTCP